MPGYSCRGGLRTRRSQRHLRSVVYILDVVVLNSNRDIEASHPDPLRPEASSAGQDGVRTVDHRYVRESGCRSQAGRVEIGLSCCPNRHVGRSNGSGKK